MVQNVHQLTLEHRPEDLRKQTILVSEEREFQGNEIASTETQLGACRVRVGTVGAKMAEECVPGEDGDEGKKVTGSAKIWP